MPKCSRARLLFCVFVKLSGGDMLASVTCTCVTFWRDCLSHRAEVLVMPLAAVERVVLWRVWLNAWNIQTVSVICVFWTYFFYMKSNRNDAFVAYVHWFFVCVFITLLLLLSDPSLSLGLHTPTAAWQKPPLKSSILSLILCVCVHVYPNMHAGGLLCVSWQTLGIAVSFALSPHWLLAELCLHNSVGRQQQHSDALSVSPPGPGLRSCPTWPIALIEIVKAIWLEVVSSQK